METEYDNIVDQLEEILEKNRDAEKGYAKAAENAQSPALSSYFSKKSADRKTFNDKLRREMVASYEDIDDDSSFTGTMHRAWMDVKAFFSSDNDEAMLEEAIKGDRAAVEEYEEVLENTALPVGIMQLLQDQKTKIRTDLNKIRSMEDLKDI